MLYDNTLQNHVQEFRAVHKSYKPSTLTHVDPDDIIHINCYTDPITHMSFILWSEIEQAFEEALFVRNKINLLPYLKGADYRPLVPERIAAVPEVVLDVVVGGELVTLTKVAYPANKAKSALQNFLHIDYALKAPVLDVPPPVPSQDSQNAEGSSAQKVEVSSSKSDRQTETPPSSTNDVKALNPRAPHEVVKRQLSKLERRPQDPQGHAAAVLKAAHQGLAEPQFKVALLMTSADEFDVDEPDPATASTIVAWFRKLADQGHAQAQGGVPQDDRRALEWYHKASDQGPVEVQCKVGGFYEMGRGVVTDEIKTMGWYVKAAEQGQVDARFKVAACYEEGKGGDPVNCERTFEWYTKAGWAGHQLAQGRVDELTRQ
ncbi:hypothetical protein BG015_011103 [Linnemannia schmuckeri]|uniref:HCP-like protein n=1 Tax=Linnemannia schmuckeri TaxID=64567 RepID=A0A9P5RTK7_9FUNG|nr:hypothetical protein BG015_011103 [Linnemannia schmuckeri]